MFCGQSFRVIQSVIKASANKSKKDKKKGKKNADSVALTDGQPPGEGSETEDAAAKGDISVTKKEVEMTAEEIEDEEWGKAKDKGKGKKGKGKKKRLSLAATTAGPKIWRSISSNYRAQGRWPTFEIHFSKPDLVLKMW